MVAAGGGWEAAVYAAGLQPRQTSDLARGENVEGIDDSAALTQAAFALQNGEISQPISIGDRNVVVKLLERTPSVIPPYEEVSDTVREVLLQERSRALARQKADEYLAAVKAGRTLVDLAQAVKAQVEETGLFSRNSTIPKLGRSPGFINDLFRMNVGEARVVDLLDQPAIVILKERTAFDEEAYAKEKGQMRDQVLRQKRERAFTQWSDDLHWRAQERHEIVVNESLVAVL